MEQVIFENLVNIMAAVIMMLISVLGTWLTMKLAKHAELQNINAAQKELIGMAQITVGELQQTIVEEMKAAAVDGKLSEEEIKELGELLYNKTVAKMSNSTYNLLTAAGVDIVALIHGAGEAWIAELK